MIEVGNVYEGRVSGVKPFGACVMLPEGHVGMVHISEVSNTFVENIAAVLHDGDLVRVQVIGIAPDGKIALSIKRLLPPPPHPPRPPRPAKPRPSGPRRDAPRPGGGGRAPKEPREPREPREGGGRGGHPGGGGRGEHSSRVWQPKAAAKPDNMSFEDMMSRFKSQSEEKMADLDHETNNRRGGGYAPRGRGGRR